MVYQFFREIAHDLRMHETGLPEQAEKAKLQIRRAAFIADFLASACDNKNVCENVWDYAYGSWAQFGATEREGGEAALRCILAHIRVEIADDPDLRGGM